MLLLCVPLLVYCACGVIFQRLVGILYAQLARFREVETPLARILHEYLYQTAVVVGFAEVGIQLDGLRVVVIGFGQVPRDGIQTGSVVIAVCKCGIELYGIVYILYGVVVVIRARAGIAQAIRRVGVEPYALIGGVDSRYEVYTLGPRWEAR